MVADSPPWHPMSTQDSFSQCLSAVEAAVTKLLSFSTHPPPHITGHPSIPEIEEDLLRLQAISQSIDDATSWLARWTLHIINASRPINRIPPEILSDIFLFATNAPPWLDENDKARRAMCLSHVSRSWRAVALSHSALWSNISTEWTHAQQDVWLTRSRLAPLYLGIGPQHNVFYMSPRIAENATRIHTITASNVDPKNLRKMSIGYTLDPWIMTLPSLRNVNLRAINFVLVEDTIHDLWTKSFPWTELEIMDGYLDAQLLLKVLDACPELRKLILVNVHCMSEQLDLVECLITLGRISNTSLPYLTHLSIHLMEDDDATMRILCRYMVAPSLISLTLEMDIAAQSPTHWNDVESASNNVVGLTQFLEKCPRLSELNIRGPESDINHIISNLVIQMEKTSSFSPSLRVLAIAKRSGALARPEEMWDLISNFVAKRAAAIPGANDVLDTLLISGVPQDWPVRTMSRVGAVEWRNFV